MSARNIFHAAVVQALRDDGWTITDDPLVLPVGSRELYVDLGAERPVIGAERGPDRIAVEIQSFLHASAVRALQEALGQYNMYRAVLDTVDPQRRLYMAVTRRVQDQILSERLGEIVLRQFSVKLLIFDEVAQKVLQWRE